MEARDGCSSLASPLDSKPVSTVITEHEIAQSPQRRFGVVAGVISDSAAARWGYGSPN